jgi:cobalamin biosynthesis protein CobD/CbiB
MNKQQNSSFKLGGAVEALIFIGAIFGAAILYAIQKAAITAPGRALHRKFVELGQVPGKSMAEIIAKVGQPTTSSALPNGRVLLQWQATGCHMAMSFNGEVCEGYTHQHLQK